MSERPWAFARAEHRGSSLAGFNIYCAGCRHPHFVTTLPRDGRMLKPPCPSSSITSVYGLNVCFVADVEDDAELQEYSTAAYLIFAGWRMSPDGSLFSHKTLGIATSLALAFHAQRGLDAMLLRALRRSRPPEERAAA